jgi:hypothetical protein
VVPEIDSILGRKVSVFFFSQQQLFPDGLGLYDSLVHCWQSLLLKNEQSIRMIIMPNRHLGKAKKTPKP